MILKKYQQTVIDDLSEFVSLLDEHEPKAAFGEFWKNKKDGLEAIMKPYQDVIQGVPNVCVKIPTGGGKTFVACAALKPIFDVMPLAQPRAVVWLVPSDTILEQTKKNLQNPHHDYRQRIDVDFSNKVEVYEKSQLLGGQNFSPSTVMENLSVFVLSYDSFRATNKEGRKSYQENGNLAEFAKFFNRPDLLLADTDETALIQVIRCLCPIIVVDESHHATSTLSREMLTNFNPSFILELTATPKSTSNIISYVDANALKRESMIKLPVIVYNRRSKEEVVQQAIASRERLERKAKGESRYIRPIVLFQAEPKGKGDCETFEKLKEKLIALDIPKEQIAIQTAEIKELKGVDLLSEKCEIRYIITVNALKEGWDCPFAYILATVANRTSKVDVEQIVGRILRLPHTERKKDEFLNYCYVFTSSNAFQETLANVVAGLQNAGFTDKDYRAIDTTTETTEESAFEATQQSFADTENAPAHDVDDTDFNVDLVKSGLKDFRRQDDEREEVVSPEFAEARKQAADYETKNADDDLTNAFNLPSEVVDKMKPFTMNEEFKEEAEALLLPQFVVPLSGIALTDDTTKLLEKEDLYKGFELKNKNAEIDFTNVDAESVSIDVDGKSTPKIKSYKLWDNASQREFFRTQPPEIKIRQCKDKIINLLNKDNVYDKSDLSDFVERIVRGLTPEQIEDLQEDLFKYYRKIKDKIDTLRREHAKSEFKKKTDTEEITCEPYYRLPKSILPIKYTKLYPKSLYAAEEDMNEFEKKVVMKLSSDLDNIKWWHRNPSRTGFAINGYINAYPDIIAMTNGGKILLIEPKGGFLDNADSRQKAEIGRRWQDLAGKDYRYFMVFEDIDPGIEGMVSLDKFLGIVKKL